MRTVQRRRSSPLDDGDPEEQDQYQQPDWRITAQGYG